MKYMLDTNICIFAIKHKPPAAHPQFPSARPGRPVHFRHHLRGADAWRGESQSTAQNRAAITLFLSAMAILSFDDCAAEEYGQIRVDLERKGTPIGPLDTLIAAHARSRGLTLVTNNTREFFRVENLPVEDWTK